MKDLTKALEEDVGQLGIADQKDLLNFVQTYSAELEGASDEKTVKEILDRALAAESISQQGMDILSAAVQKFLRIGPIDLQQAPPVDTGDSTPIADESAAASTDDATDTQPAPPADTEVSTPREPGQKLDRMKLGQSSVSSISGGAGGLLWLLALYLMATWVAIGSLSSIQFRDDIDQKYKTTLRQVMDLKNIESIKSVEAVSALCVNATAADQHCNKLKEVLPPYLSYVASKKEEDGLNVAKDAPEKNSEKKILDDLSMRVEFMESFGYLPMLVMPDQVLTLLLAMAMGVLGSTITMTWTFLEENQSPSLRWYLLRPFVGALSALVIFIFAKAGQMTLTANAGDQTLSPFLLSLLGIASGLLSDRAYAQMSSVSGRFIGGVGAEQERWSSHIQEELNKKQMTADQLATALNLNKQRIAAIVNGQQKASVQEQQRISDYLGVTPRLLFTDIPP